ncbi:hypothetical protein NQ315_000602 [Exocentrus adspersus]|uniref:RNase H type-1 domain-containing protein n=1 Tax=Exocentrus adspersus TaxID=1586481 RepID=A0AAV8VNV5_9CUCU|nr:hypothetical protein NQ315_000602 [Exocentrus adspersus]
MVKNESLKQKGYNMFIPGNMAVCKGIVKFINKKFTDDDLWKYSGTDYHKILNIKRLNRRTTSEQGTPVIQCYNCFRYGHTQGSMQVCSRLVWDCVKALQELGSRNKLTLAWVPGHKRHKGNEEADRLVREGAGRALIGPEPFCGIAKTHVRASIDEWMDGKSREWWRKLPQQRQAKMFIKERSARLTDDF